MYCVRFDLSLFTFESRQEVYILKVLTERLKSETKKFLMDGHRYKIVASVVITQDADQNMQICSRCLWETEYDTVISHTYNTKSLIAVANIYCVHTP